MPKKIAIIGGSSFAKEIIEVILMNGDEVYGIFAKENSLNYKYFGYLDELSKHKNSFDGVILGIGAVNKKGIENRREIIEFVKENGIELISVISPLATISKSVKIGKGVYIGHKALISCDTKIGDNVLINYNATIGHDVEICENVSIAPQVFIGGGVIIEKDVMIGANASIKQGIKIKKDSVIGMGSVVIKDIKENSLVLSQLSKVYNSLN